ncbi:hypothetical protein DPMN_052791 [Dreissena polymorpha]|uniref:Uncharacterized protein n=1 Tax=Dreissena polymorpha TaxID=45954 RepID=A0A9D4CLL3_DREPO|nr:hypothetical protein DPMN_052791 [Dreissena polymorpha]
MVETIVRPGEYEELVEVSIQVVREDTGNGKSELHIPTAIHSELDGYLGSRLDNFSPQQNDSPVLDNAYLLISINDVNRCHKTIVLALNIETISYFRYV